MREAPTAEIGQLGLPPFPVEDKLWWERLGFGSKTQVKCDVCSVFIMIVLQVGNIMQQISMYLLSMGINVRIFPQFINIC